MKGLRLFRRSQQTSRALWPGSLGRGLRELARDTSGSTVTVVAIISPVLIGGMGLGAETSYWYFTQRALQHAADVAAHAAGVRNRSGDSEDEMEAAALDVAAKAGFTSDNSTLTMAWPPISGPNAGNSDAVEVVLTRTMPRMFSALFNDEPVTARARAVSFVQLGQTACVLALAPTASAAMSVTGSASLDLNGCDIASNSMASDALSMAGSASLSARCAHTVGGASTNANLTLDECEEVREYVSVTPDPYRLVADPVVPATCHSTNKNVGNPSSSTTVTPSSTMVSGMPVYHFCNGVMLKGNVTFQPGLYILSGDFEANAGAVVNGTGVTFYMNAPSKVQLNGNAQLNLSAPTSGELSGILFFGDRAGSNITHKVNGTSDSNLQGAIYFPTTSVEYSGSSATGGGGCTQVVGYTVTFTGNTGLATNCAAAGTEDIMVNETVALVE